MGIKKKLTVTQGKVGGDNAELNGEGHQGT